MNTKQSWTCKLVKYLTIWMYGGTSYYIIEVLFRWITQGRAWSHPSMYVLGGICLIWLNIMNNKFSWDLGFVWQILIGTTGVIILEFIAGLILNVWWGLGVWDYSHLPLNIMGQFSVLFFFLFMPVVAYGLWLIDFLDWKLFNNGATKDKPHYALF